MSVFVVVVVVQTTVQNDDATDRAQIFTEASPYALTQRISGGIWSDESIRRYPGLPIRSNLLTISKIFPASWTPNAMLTMHNEMWSNPIGRFGDIRIDRFWTIRRRFQTFFQSDRHQMRCWSCTTGRGFNYSALYALLPLVFDTMCIYLILLNLLIKCQINYFD